MILLAQREKATTAMLSSGATPVDPARCSAAAVMAGLNSVGVDTIDLGIIPVGAVSRLVRDSGATYGVMVSASHNPAADNGIKFFGANGTKLSDADEAAIEAATTRALPGIAASVQRSGSRR